MKISSKSILSPGRAGGRDPPISLTTSLSRRLRTNRSIKGGASPAMFPTPGKKRGGGFENPEPSSPKVTCIGQVRVKSKKKHGKRLRSLSRRHSTGDVSFRKLDHSRDGFSKSTNLGSNYQRGSSFGSNQDNMPEQRNNQRWVHLPLTICEALRAFGSEFSCLFPCRSSCFSPSTEREKEGKTATGRGEEIQSDRQSSGSCAAVFTRWLLAFQDGDDGGRGSRRDIELLVGDEDEDVENSSIRASRRHVFDDLEIVNDRIEGTKDEARVSICIPPKNALLLMRCRSDPLKMEALANRLWESTNSQNNEQDEEFSDYEDDIQQKTCDAKESHDNDQDDEANQVTNMKQSIEEKEQIIENNVEKEEITFFGSLFDEIVDQGQETEEIDGMEDARELFEEEGEILETETEESKLGKVKGFEGKTEEETVTQFAEGSETAEEMVAESTARESVLKGLPDCLLLMMCEPKLSLEVSKETWVSSKDFLRRPSSWKKPPPPPPPQPVPVPVKPTDGQDESKVSSANTTTTTFASASKFEKHVTAVAAAAAAAPIQRGRSSCSLPAPPSMAEMLEQKLVNAVGYEPFVLTRCKSEPMRTAAAKLAPDNCFWKNRKLEPLRRASFGVGAAGIGF